jgi:hypothetical protein
MNHDSTFNPHHRLRPPSRQWILQFRERRIQPNAAALFSLSALLCGLIGAISGTAPSPMPVGWSFTANSDGTVTLTPPAS